MLIFDQLRKNDRQLQVLAICVLTGLDFLLIGLWYVQVVSARRYQTSQINQSFRTVRIPAIRGKVFDANGVALAENRPSYNVNLYLDELRPYSHPDQCQSAAHAQSTHRVGQADALSSGQQPGLSRGQSG